ncbi:MAG: hypothetical protein K6F77_01145 [Lachnospiraceae bacterium]|nr:hypothetical protein [Lachnospiraceae bacterium]
MLKNRIVSIAIIISLAVSIFSAPTNCKALIGTSNLNPEIYSYTNMDKLQEYTTTNGDDDVVISVLDKFDYDYINFPTTRINNVGDTLSVNNPYTTNTNTNHGTFVSNIILDNTEFNLNYF